MSTEIQQTAINFSFTDLEMMEVVKIIDGVRYMIAQATKLLDKDRDLSPENRKIIMHQIKNLCRIEKKLINQAIDHKEKLDPIDRVAAEVVMGKYQRM